MSTTGWLQSFVAGPWPGEETCDSCEPVGLFGVAPASDPRYFGGFVDAGGARHDPLTHAENCPIRLAVAQEESR